MNTSYAIFLSLGAVLTVVELFGVFRDPDGPGKGEDTISEMWWSFRNRYPLVTVAMVGFLLWLLYHFTVEGWRRH